MSAEQTVENIESLNGIPQLDPALLQSAFAAAVATQEDDNQRVRVGVVGFSSAEFDIDRAKTLLEGCLYTLEAMDPGQCDLVSGLTDLGVPALAYRVAASLKWPTVGYACAKAKEYECYPVDEEHIIGEEWGDESEDFLADIDLLIKVGGGEQSKREFEAFQGPKWELPL